MKKWNQGILLNSNRLFYKVSFIFLLGIGFCYAEPINVSKSHVVAWGSNKLTAELLHNAEAKRKFIQNLIKKIKNTDSYKQLDDDDKEWLLSYLEEEVFPSLNKNKFENALDWDFSEKDKNKLLNFFPDIYAWMPKVSVEELDNLSKLDIKEVLDEYIKTWKLPKWFELFRKDFDEIKTIINEKKVIINEKKIIIRRWEEAIRKWEEAKRKAKKAKEIEDKLNWIIKEMKKISESVK